MNAILALEDGRVFCGNAFGHTRTVQAPGIDLGHVVVAHGAVDLLELIVMVAVKVLDFVIYVVASVSSAEPSAPASSSTVSVPVPSLISNRG